MGKPVEKSIYLFNFRALNYPHSFTNDLFTAPTTASAALYLKIFFSIKEEGLGNNFALLVSTPPMR